MSGGGRGGASETDADDNVPEASWRQSGMEAGGQSHVTVGDGGASDLKRR